MIAGRICAAVLAPALLAGCASDWQRSGSRWRAYGVGTGPYAQWARCIGDRSNHYLDTEDASAGNRAQLFVQVLADCRPFMAGPAWNALSDELRRQLIEDAHWAFLDADSEIRERREMGVI